MIVVIADDLSGAAELANVALQTGSVLRATVRVGIAECPADGTDVDALAAVARSRGLES